MPESSAGLTNTEAAPASSYGLRAQVLSPLETLAQSVAAIAPCTTPALTIPLVFGLAGNGVWLAYALAMAWIVLMAFCIAAFARDSASPGSLFVYTRATLPPVFGAVAAWALLFAYVVTAASVTGGFMNYAYVFLGGYGARVPGVLVAAVGIGLATWIAHHDIKLSAELMLWVEVIAVFLIALVIALVLWKHGLHLDGEQLRLKGVTVGGVRLGAMLAVFSFVGFESATTLGAEARNPLKTIPRAVVQSALLAGVLFVVCAYGEVLGFAGAKVGLGENTAPLRFLSTQVGVGLVGPVIDAGVLVSMFSCILACVIAGARVLMLMAHHGMVHERLAKASAESETPGAAGIVAGVLAFAPVAVLAWRGSSGADIYAWMGTLAVFGFLTAYGLVAIALPVYLRRRGRLGVRAILLSVCAIVSTGLAMVWTVYPVAPPPYRYLPYVYGVYLTGGPGWYWMRGRRDWA